jgi:putative peptidoglycan lipid II flippase
MVSTGIYQINMAVDTILVSLVGTGAISWLYYANRLQQLPLGVVGAAISVALLPLLSKSLKAGNIDEARQTQNKAVEYGLLLAFPAAVLLIVFAEPIVRLLFQHGKFLSADATKTAYAVVAYSVGLPCYVLTKALMPNFFARGDTVTPVKYSAVVFATNFIFNVLLMQFFGHIGIATATTIAAFVSLGQYIHGLKKRNYWQFSSALLKQSAKIIFISILTGALIWPLRMLLITKVVAMGKLWLFGGLGVAGVIALAIFLGLAKICGVINFREIVAGLRRKNG